ncbi:Por secretion system C-terminal sorting domain-containing protein [Chryseobacterium soldanellicola]|uniref:Por secretion system C-terminal sorting domain-containing protein n=1 Tax=Chryseobacterium soldanellicola TaxID=311333 RepID=A0A1H1AI31_9FLAO|nr:T9SS type A sorting domain-containing protein [Chryseobacterium soldanellicola]SDQ39181.1 Por secretion system C-terminal sorting domain-containing protein [Chryseobacterium soldanellicola]
MKKLLLPFLLIGAFSNAQIFSENFNGGSLPSGWTTENPDTAFNWGVGSQNGVASFPSGAAFFDDDDAGPGSINHNARLISPVINLAGASNPKLSFKYANIIYDFNSILKVEAFNGTSWVQVFTASGDAGTFTIDFSTLTYVLSAYVEAANIDLAPYVNPNFRLRFVYDDAGDYSYTAVVDDVMITGTVLGTSDVKASEKLNVYPNPVVENVYIKSDELKINSKITVTDMSGKVVKTFIGKSDGYNLSDLSKGAYLITIDNGKEIVTKKIIKK